METPDETKHQTSPTPFRLHRLYTLALVVLAVSLTLGQAATQWQVSVLLKKIQVIQYASLQRHQSQQLLSKSLQLRSAATPADFNAYQAELATILDDFTYSRQQTDQGQLLHRRFWFRGSDQLSGLYNDVAPFYDTLSRSAWTISRYPTAAALSTPVGQQTMQQLVSSQKPFLEKMDLVVRRSNLEIREQLVLLQQIEFFFYFLTLVLVVFIGVRVFRPAIRQLKQTIDQLITAETNTAESNRKLVRLNRSLHEARQRLFAATKQQHQQEISEQKTRASSLIAGQEEERRRLSRDLHDGLGQMLTGIKLQVEGLETHLTRTAAPDETAVQKRLLSLKDLITQTISETRSISNDLMPSVLSDFGLVPALKMLAETAQTNESRENGISREVHFETNLSGGRLDKQIEFSLYRITQEAVTNALRHGNPTQITLELIERENYLHLVVTDNGTGFEAERLRESQRTSQGIRNMQERTKLLNGRFRIRSVSGQGTRLFVSIPYQIDYSTYEYDTINAR